MLHVGASTQFQYVISPSKTVPHLYPESPEFQDIPAVFATGYMVGLMEWTCIRHLNEHLDPERSSVGTHIETSHISASLPGMTVEISARIAKLDDRRITWFVTARDDRDIIGEGTHTRTIINRQRFIDNINSKAAALHIPPLEGADNVQQTSAQTPTV